MTSSLDEAKEYLDMEELSDNDPLKEGIGKPGTLVILDQPIKDNRKVL